MIIKKLPHWVISNPNPSFFETEGGTVLEQTGIMYKKVQELIEHYNSFVDEINNTIDEFISNTLADQEEFEVKINQMIHDFTSLVRTELQNQNTTINEFIDYVTNQVDNVISQRLLELFESNTLTLEYNYNPDTESLDITGVVVTERSDS